jgi:glycine/D-amino acid oxidase-like deaminating enzyme
MSISRRQFVTHRPPHVAVAASMRNTAYASGAGEPDVIVIGAGLSGLATAMELEANGLKVLLLEGRQRIGGRIYTLFDVPGHPEVGFNSLANAYGRTIDMAARVGVEIVNLAPEAARESRRPGTVPRRQAHSTQGLGRPPTQSVPGRHEAAAALGLGRCDVQAPHAVQGSRELVRPAARAARHLRAPVPDVRTVPARR